VLPFLGDPHGGGGEGGPGKKPQTGPLEKKKYYATPSAGVGVAGH